MDISLITSLYRTADHLESFLSHLIEVIPQVISAGRTIESIIIANDATPQERILLDQLPDDLAEHIHVHYVQRETLYATWNRGVNLALGTTIGFWNVDDIRTSEGLLEAHRYISAGRMIYYAPYQIRSAVSLFGIPDQQYVRVHQVPEFDRTTFTRYPIAGPFFMFSAAAHQQFGPFDERFRILGDFEWWVRTAKHIEFVRGETISGTFLFHGTNLSMSRQRVLGEENIIHLLHGNYDRLKWMNPHILENMLEDWREDIPPIPTEVLESYIGEPAQRRWQRQAWRRAVAPPALIAFLRLVINRTGLRWVLYKIGMVKSKHPY